MSEIVCFLKAGEIRALAVLTESASLAIYLESHKLDNWKLDDEYVKIIWLELEKSDLYKKYLNSEEDSFQEDKSFLISFYKEIIAKALEVNDLIINLRKCFCPTNTVRKIK